MGLDTAWPHLTFFPKVRVTLCRSGSSVAVHVRTEHESGRYECDAGVCHTQDLNFAIFGNITFTFGSKTVRRGPVHTCRRACSAVSPPLRTRCG